MNTEAERKEEVSRTSRIVKPDNLHLDFLSEFYQDPILLTAANMLINRQYSAYTIRVITNSETVQSALQNITYRDDVPITNIDFGITNAFSERTGLINNSIIWGYTTPPEPLAWRVDGSIVFDMSIYSEGYAGEKRVSFCDSVFVDYDLRKFIGCGKTQYSIDGIWGEELHLMMPHPTHKDRWGLYKADQSIIDAILRGREYVPNYCVPKPKHNEPKHNDYDDSVNKVIMHFLSFKTLLQHYDASLFSNTCNKIDDFLTRVVAIYK